MPWARRGRLNDRLEAATYRDATQESVFGGYHPDAPTVEMGAISPTAFDEPPPLPAPPPGPVTWQPPPTTEPTRQPPPPDTRRPAPAPPTAPPPPAAPAPPTAPPPAAPTPPAAAEGPPPEPSPPSASRRSSFLVAAGILLSRISGVIRETVMANYLATTTAADAFRAALRIPNLLQNLLGEGVLSASFIPVYARLQSEGDEREAGRLAGAVAGLLITLTGILSVIGLLLARPITALITPGVGSQTYDLTVDLVRIMFPGIGFLVLSAWCLGVLNSHRRFFLSYVAPVLWNAAQVGALVTVAWRSGSDHRSMAVALAWGVLIGGVLQLAVQLGPVLKLVRWLQLSLDTRRDSVRDVLRRFGPVVLSRGSVQVLAFFDLVLASWLMGGAIASMGYAQVLYLLPISLFGMSVAAAELPDLSQTRVYDPETRRVFRRRLEDGMARIAFYVTPTATIFIVAGDVIVKVLLEHGEFTPVDTQAVWLVLAAFSLGLPAVTSSRLLINGLFALDDARTPARLAVIRVLLAAAIGLALMFHLDRLFVTLDGIDGWGDVLGGFTPFPRDVRDANVIPHLGIVGLAIGTSIAAWTEYLMLSRALAMQVGRTHLAGRWLNPIAASCAAAALVAVGLIALTNQVDVLTGNALAPSVIRAALVLGPAGLSYLAVAARLGVPEGRALLGRIARLSPIHPST